MQRSNRELWMAFIAIVAITAIYLFMVLQLDGIPGASDFFGHSIGVLGFILMLMTETLYSLRKRSRQARWGRMADWLDFHIFTGIVGPYLVLLHTSWKFNGLAGLVTLLTVIIVASGFVGRYIYTAVPRTADGVEMEANQIAAQISAIEADLQRWLQDQPEVERSLAQPLAAGAGGGAAASIFESGQARQRLQAVKQQIARGDGAARSQVQQMERLFKRRESLRRQVASLATARRTLALWHAIHIPIGMALFTAAFIHIIAAIYYATLLR